MAKFKTRIVTREEDVPAGFVRLTSCYKVRSPEHSAICHARKAGLIETYKLVRTEGDFKKGALFIIPEQVAAFLSAKADAKKQRTEESVVVPVKEVFLPAGTDFDMRWAVTELTAAMKELARSMSEMKVAMDLRAEKELYGTEA